jgi:hypothetical protein
MKRRQTLEILLGLGGGICFVILAARFFQRGDLTMGLLTGAAGIAFLVLAGQDFAKWRRL